jgi:SAM-dependent methyltransferase
MQYGTDHADVYDLVWTGRGKDFGAEVERLTELIRSRFPAAGSVLDVACGTGAHLELLAGSFGHVEGIELAPAMREVACRRLPDRPVHAADMRDFNLGRTFDAVICLGNSVACLDSPAELAQAIARMTAHLVPGGVLVIEPWFFSGGFLDGRVDGNLTKQDGRVVSQITRFSTDENRIRMEARFLVADAAGFRDFSEVLTAKSFTRREYLAALEAAGLRPQFVRGFTLADGLPTGPGLFVAVR